MKKRILITGMGDGGSNNLYRSIRSSKLELENYEFIGSNISPEILVKSPLEENYLLPVATDNGYKESLQKLIRTREIDLVMPNNDREVNKIARIRDELDCRVFLPPTESILICHDKYRFFTKLSEAGIPMAKAYQLSSFDDVREAIALCGGERFWVRPRGGSGSRGATWVRNADEAIAWINLWISLRGYQIEDFTVSEFLPGKDYCVQSVWNCGEPVVVKMCQRLSYIGGENRLSGTASSPSFAITLRDDAALDTVFKSVEALADEPEGNFSFDMKERSDGVMCVTECNIGRFCMITPIFDLTGKHNTAEMYIRSAFDEEYPQIEDPVDIEEGFCLVRGIDTEPLVVHGSVIDKLNNNRLDYT